MNRRARQLALAIAVGTMACQRTSGPSVVFDESLDELFSIHDAGFMGYSRAAAGLRVQGYEVWANPTALGRVLPTLQPAERHLVVIGQRFGGSFGGANVSALRRFAAAGGSVLLVAEHDNIYGGADAANDLLLPLGVEVLPGRAAFVRDQRRSPGPLTVVALPESQDSAALYFAAPLHVTGPGVDVLAADLAGQPVAAGARLGRGKVLVVTDAEFLWNGTPNFGIRAVGNAKLLASLVRHAIGRGLRAAPREWSLSGASVPSHLTAYDDPLHPRFTSRPDGFLHLVEDLRARGVSVEITNDAARAAAAPAVLVTAPAPNFRPRAPGNQRLVVLLTSRSSFAFPEIARLGGKGLPDSDPDMLDLDPIDDVLQSSGFRIDPAVLRDSAGRFDVTGASPSGGPSCVWRRAAAMRRAPGQAGAHDVRASAYSPADPQLLWFSNRAGKLFSPLIEAPDGGWPLLVETHSLFALASGSPLENGSHDSVCYNETLSRLVRWLAAAPT